MARCLRCKAGNEWIEGNVPPESPESVERIEELLTVLRAAREIIENDQKDGDWEVLDRIDKALDPADLNSANPSATVADSKRQTDIGNE